MNSSKRNLNPPIGMHFFQCLGLVLLLFCFNKQTAKAQTFLLKASIYESDSFSRIPFAVVGLKGKMDAVMTDESGYFEMRCRWTDTLLISHVSFGKLYLAVRQIGDTSGKKVKIYLKKKEVELIPVTISGKKLSKEKKEEYERHLDRFRPTISSPISALYETFSRRGKERTKMDEIYSGLLLRDLLESRLPPRKLFLITNDRSVTLDELLVFCPVSSQFATYASDYDFFYHFSKCWESFKSKR